METYVVLHVHGDGLVLEEADHVHVALTRRPVDGVVSVLKHHQRACGHTVTSER